MALSLRRHPPPGFHLSPPYALGLKNVKVCHLHTEGEVSAEANDCGRQHKAGSASHVASYTWCVGTAGTVRGAEHAGHLPDHLLLRGRQHAQGDRRGYVWRLRTVPSALSEGTALSGSDPLLSQGKLTAQKFLLS